MKAAIFLLVTILSSNAFAETCSGKVSYIFGAGGEPSRTGGVTVFDRSFRNLAAHMPDDYETHLYVDDASHAGLKKLIDQSFHQKIVERKGFSTEDYNQGLKQLEKTLNSNPAPCQVLVVVNSHGAMQSPNQTTHSVMTSNGRANLDNLKKVLDRAPSNVKVAVADLGCYSGPSLSMASSHVCAISGAVRTPAYSLFTEDFFKEFRKGRSLESAFLTGRSKSNRFTALPQISTPAGLSLARDEERGLDKFIDIDFGNGLVSDLTHQAKQDLKVCQDGSQPLTRMAQMIAELDEAVRQGILSPQHVHDLKENIRKYADLQKQYENYLASKDKSDQSKLLAQNEDFSFTFKNEDDQLMKRTYHMSWDEILNGNLSNLGSWPKTASEAQADKDFSAQIASKRQQILHDYPQLGGDHVYDDLTKKVYDQAYYIKRQEQNVYAELYANRSKKLNGPNPCRSFVL